MQKDNTIYSLPQELREKLKQPVGRLIPDEQVDNYLQELKSIPDLFLVTVGDRTTQRCEKAGLEPFLEIIDNREKRESASYQLSPRRTTVASNPAGTITKEAMREVEAALKGNSRSRLVISGEEDLLVLPCIVFARDGMLILYGQPGEGIVALTVDDISRSTAKEILEKMKT